MDVSGISNVSATPQVLPKGPKGRDESSLGRWSDRAVSCGHLIIEILDMQKGSVNENPMRKNSKS